MALYNKKNIEAERPDAFPADLAEHLSLSLAVIGCDGVILSCNPAFSRQFALPPAGPMPNIVALTHVDDRDGVRTTLAQTMLDNERHSFEARMFLFSGDAAWVQIQLSRLPSDSHDGGIEILAEIFNIDHHKRAEDARKEWEERWHFALVSSQLGVWDHNFETGVFYYSDTWKSLRGYRPDEAIDPEFDVWINKVHPDDRDRITAAVERQNSGEDPVSVFEYRERHRDGHWIWIECRGAAIEWDVDGRPTRIVGTDTDVSERKAAEEEMGRISRRLELALDVSQIGVFESDVDQKTTIWDDRIQSIFGIEGTSKNKEEGFWLSMVHPADRERVLARAPERTGVQGVFTNEFRIIRPDGSIRYVRARVAPFVDSNGARKKIGANWDVTEDFMIRAELQSARLLAEARNRELEAAKAKIEHNALHDFLTGLPNRRYLDAVLSEKARACSPDEGLIILHVDLDRFKQINDTLGHRAGDAMLQHAANVLRDSAGSEDFVARIGGDEFVVVSTYRGSTLRFAQLADAIIRRICEPVHYEGHTCRIGASIGIAFDGTRGIREEGDAKQLLLNADIALYRAKRLGRNRFEFFTVAIQAEVVNIKRISDEILVGLESRAFTPFYQLQFKADTLDIAGAETLARWRHPERGILGPDKFLPIAEDLDVVAAIDGAILEQALADFARWQARGIAIPRISANVSARRLGDPDLVGKLKRYRIDPGTVSFELLESIFLDDCDDLAIENLAAIRALGIGIEIDDFGTGHASIVSLLKISPNALKIDRELIRRITETPEQRRLVGSIIDIGRSLNIQVLAEGVETGEHIRILRDLGCDLLQGYALARPKPFEAIEPFIAKAAWRDVI